MAVLSIKNVSKKYTVNGEDVSVLKNISLSVEPGEFVAIIGHSGSGKSTLLNCAGCLDTPSDGSVLINGSDTCSLSDKALSALRNKEIGFVFQAYNLLHSLTAIENVELPLKYRGMPRSERKSLALEALEQVGLFNRIHHYPSQLSGGQQQRTAIARALVTSPSLLLADEPTGNLDPESGSEILSLLTKQRVTGQAMLLITHDRKIASMADRVFSLENGTLISV